jgi:hypothetical protein
VAEVEDAEQRRDHHYAATAQHVPEKRSETDRRAAHHGGHVFEDRGVRWHVVGPAERSEQQRQHERPPDGVKGDAVVKRLTRAQGSRVSEERARIAEIEPAGA